jgi:hypothetical protein
MTRALSKRDPGVLAVVSLMRHRSAAEYLANAFASVSNPIFHWSHPIADTSCRSRGSAGLEAAEPGPSVSVS